MITTHVEMVYEVYCDECGVKVGDWQIKDNYVPKQKDFLSLFAMFHTSEGKDICQSCFTKNISKYRITTSTSNIDKCQILEDKK
jgi:hypothetical protein